MEGKEMRQALSPGEYWEWRTTISEMEVAKLRLEKVNLELKLFRKESEMLSVRIELFQKTKVDLAKEDFQNSLKEYERFKKSLEEELGQSLNGKLIDDITFEIKDLPGDTNNIPPDTGKEI